MSKHKVLAVWFLWLLAVVQAWPGQQQKQHRHDKQGQQRRQEPLNAFLGVLAAQTAPGVATYESVQAYNHSLALTLRQNGECGGWAHAHATTAHANPVYLQHSNHPLLLLLLPDAGLVYRGSSARLRRVLSKLLHGEPVHIAAVGSAITYGRGVTRGSSDWFSLFSSWLQSAFPAVRVTARNSALPAARSEHLSACLDQHVDPLADLVFVEVSIQQGK